MSRSVRVGDIAVVTIDGQEYSLGITDIHPTSINIGDYTLVPNNGSWVIRNYPTKHSINFKASLLPISSSDIGLSTSTHIPEIISRILLSLDYKHLIHACQINKDFNRACQDDYFWKLKVEHDYGTVIQNKPPNITYRQQYVDFMTIKDPNKAMELGRLDILKWLAQNNIYPAEYATAFAAAHGKLELLKWLDQNGIHPIEDDVTSAMMNGQLEVVKWLVQIKRFYPSQDIINGAAASGQLEVLKWLAQAYNLYPNQDGADDAAAYDETDVLKWLAQHNIYPN